MCVWFGPCLPGIACVCQRHRKETTVLRGRLYPPPQWAWTSPPTGGAAHTELNTRLLWHDEQGPQGRVAPPDPREQSAGCSSEKLLW